MFASSPAIGIGQTVGDRSCKGRDTQISICGQDLAESNRIGSVVVDVTIGGRGCGAVGHVDISVVGTDSNGTGSGGGDVGVLIDGITGDKNLSG